MPVLEPLHGLRVVADPAALDAARWAGTDVTVLRFAPDDALAIGATAVDLADPHAIVEPEAGFVGGVARRSTTSRATSNGRSRPSARRSPRARSRASRPRSSSRTGPAPVASATSCC